MIADPDDDLQSDGEELLNFLVPLAFRRIEREGAFDPFGAIVLAEGGVEPVDHDAPGAGDPGPDRVFMAILEALRGDAESGRFRSAGLCADVRLVKETEDEQTDAVRVYLERRDGEAMDVFLPYERTEEGEIRKGGIFAVEAEARLFIRVDPGAPQATA